VGCGLAIYEMFDDKRYSRQHYNENNSSAQKAHIIIYNEVCVCSDDDDVVGCIIFFETVFEWNFYCVPMRCWEYKTQSEIKNGRYRDTQHGYII